MLEYVKILYTSRMSLRANSDDPSTKQDKLAQVAEVLALMEETHRTKDWIFDELKKHKLKPKVKHSMKSFQILQSCPPEFIDHLLKVPKGGDIEDIDDITTLTRTYHWFFTDIVAGTNPHIPTKEQAKKIVALNELISRTETFKKRDPDATVILPTGDGMAIGFGESPEHPLRLAIQLHKALTKYNEAKRGKDKLLIRIGIDTGPVYILKDLNDRENVWGPGIIMTRRVMDLGGDMQIFASSRIAEDIRNLSPEYKAIIHPIGDYSIKHGEQLKLYNIYGDGFGSKLAPRKSKIFRERETEADFSGISTFEFVNIEIELNVLDPKTMLTHHTWTWNVVNISKESKDHIFYYLDGDCPKDFADMKVKVTDDEGNKLDVASLSVNKPYHKEFNVKLKKPIKPHQRKRFIKLEYDWEEPERNFFYKLATDCNSFKYRFTIPKGVDVKNRVLKVDTEMGHKWHASPAPIINYGKNVTEITWEGKNLKAYDAYKFEW